MVAAVRPLRVDELAEIFAVDFDPDSEPKLEEGWRPENPEEAVLSATAEGASADWAASRKATQIIPTRANSAICICAI